MFITKRMVLAVAALAAICGLNMNAQDLTANLLNGFSTLDARGNPKCWFSPLTNPISLDSGAKPGDGSTSIRVDIRNKREWGSIQQDIPVKKNTAYSFICQLKGSSSKLAFLMIKLLDAHGKEIKRFKSNDNFDDSWESVQLDFQSGNAEKVSALLRFFQTTDALGESVWFADPRLIIASNTTAAKTKSSGKIFSPELSAFPLFAGSSIYIKYGDGDYSKCNLPYRRKGILKWEDALFCDGHAKNIKAPFMTVGATRVECLDPSTNLMIKN